VLSFGSDPHLLIQLRFYEGVFVYIEMGGWMYILWDDFVYKGFDFGVAMVRIYVLMVTGDW